MTVSLVGAGPGDPGLITVRGLELVRNCDALVYDTLVAEELVAEAPEDAIVLPRDGLKQDEVNELLVTLARDGLDVVRLKGGDPFVFGRGGEEYLACVAAGVPVTVVPGISSALGGPAAAGIPLTHRGVASDFTVASGHLDPGRPADAGIDWPGLAAGAGTLVLLMAMDRLELIASELIAHGRPATTPSAVVYRATLDGQRVVRAPLGELAAAVGRAGIGAPSVIVIGDVVDILGSSGS